MKNKEDMKGLLNVLCVLQFIFMLVLIYGNIAVSDRTKDLRIAVDIMREKAEKAQAENHRLQQEKTLIFQRVANK